MAVTEKQDASELYVKLNKAILPITTYSQEDFVQAGMMDIYSSFRTWTKQIQY
jgi:hypothetical protein